MGLRGAEARDGPGASSLDQGFALLRGRWRATLGRRVLWLACCVENELKEGRRGLGQCLGVPGLQQEPPAERCSGLGWSGGCEAEALTVHVGGDRQVDRAGELHGPCPHEAYI